MVVIISLSMSLLSLIIAVIALGLQIKSNNQILIIEENIKQFPRIIDEVETRIRMQVIAEA